MTLEFHHDEIVNAVNAYLKEHQNTHLTRAEQTVLKAYLQDARQTYKQIAAATRYREGALRDAACKLFKKVHRITHQPGESRRPNKNTCGDLVRRWYEKHQPLRDQGIGREDILSALLANIQERGRRIVCVHGPPQSGKWELVTLLVQRLTQGSEPPLFKEWIICPAQSVPTLESLRQHVAKELPPNLRSQLLQEFEASPALALRQFLRRQNYILVIKNGEQLCQADSPDARFKPEADSYREWLQTLLDFPDLEGCLIWVGRVQPQFLYERLDPDYCHPVAALPPTASQKVLRDRGLDLTTETLAQLADFCGHIPGILQAMALKYKRDHRQDIIHCLQDPLNTDHPSETQWRECLQREVSPRDQVLLARLLLYPYAPVPRYTGRSRLQRQRAQAIFRTLGQRGLVAVDDQGAYYLPFSWLRHLVAEHLVESVQQSLQATPLDLERLNQHPLLLPQAPAWHSQWLRQYVLAPLAEYLKDYQNQRLWSQQAQCQFINQCLDTVRRIEAADTSWRREVPGHRHEHAVGNLLNIAIALNLPLSQLRFAGLRMRHVDLKQANIRGADFRGCEVRDSVWPVLLQEPIAAALSPSGAIVAVGDGSGQVLCWQRQAAKMRLWRFTRLGADTGAEVTQLVFGGEDTLAIVCGNTVYSWWLENTSTAPEPLMTVPAPAASLTCCGDEYVAVGLENGGIQIFEALMEEPICFEAHAGRVQRLIAPDTDGGQLASIGYGDRILLWEPFTWEMSQEIRPDRCFFFGAAWRDGELVMATMVDQRYVLRLLDGTIEPLPPHINDSCFSANGEYVALSKSSSVLVRPTIRSDLDIEIPAQSLKTMAISNDGNWLLTISDGPTMVCLWDIENQRLFWEREIIAASNGSRDLDFAVQIEGCQGFTDVEWDYVNGQL